MEQSVVNFDQVKIYSLIKILNNEGLDILVIDGEYFSTSEFFPADKNVPYHKVKGKHITKILSDFINIGLQGSNLTSIIQRINEEQTREIQYSAEMKWKWFVM